MQKEFPYAIRLAHIRNAEGPPRTYIQRSRSRTFTKTTFYLFLFSLVQTMKNAHTHTSVTLYSIYTRHQSLLMRSVPCCVARKPGSSIFLNEKKKKKKVTWQNKRMYGRYIVFFINFPYIYAHTHFLSRIFFARASLRQHSSHLKHFRTHCLPASDTQNDDD